MIKSISTIFFSLSAKRIFLIGSILLLIGIVLRMIMKHYGMHILERFEVETRTLHGTTFLLEDALLNFKIGIFISQLFFVTGFAAVFIGVGRIGQTQVGPR